MKAPLEGAYAEIRVSTLPSLPLPASNNPYCRSSQQEMRRYYSRVDNTPTLLANPYQG